MNYRHAYHAGNHTEVFKHSILCLLLTELCKKPKPFVVLDTHAGAGTYDLLSAEAQKTGEAPDGIGRVLDKTLPAAAAYLTLVRDMNPIGLFRYPGSPAITQTFLREHDRLIACELREDDAAALRANFRRDSRVSVHNRDGYGAVKAFVPLARRGLVFIDPPFERQDEFERLATALNVGINKWKTGIFAAWYPLKDRSGVRALRAHYGSGNPPTICCEFLREPLDGQTLSGSGVLICNAPWLFKDKLTNLCRALATAFNAREAEWSSEWWIRDRG